MQRSWKFMAGSAKFLGGPCRDGICGDTHLELGLCHPGQAPSRDGLDGPKIPPSLRTQTPEITNNNSSQPAEPFGVFVDIFFCFVLLFL